MSFIGGYTFSETASKVHALSAANHIFPVSAPGEGLARAWFAGTIKRDAIHQLPLAGNDAHLLQAVWVAETDHGQCSRNPEFAGKTLPGRFANLPGE